MITLVIIRLVLSRTFLPHRSSARTHVKEVDDDFVRTGQPRLERLLDLRLWYADSMEELVRFEDLQVSRYQITYKRRFLFIPSVIFCPPVVLRMR